MALSSLRPCVDDMIISPTLSSPLSLYRILMLCSSMLPSSHLHPEPCEQKVPEANPITKCLSAFSTAEIKHHDRSNLSREGFVCLFMVPGASTSLRARAEGSYLELTGNNTWLFKPQGPPPITYFCQQEHTS